MHEAWRIIRKRCDDSAQPDYTIHVHTEYQSCISYPISPMRIGEGGIPKTIIFNCRSRRGLPISRLTADQAMYYLSAIQETGRDKVAL